MKLSILCDGNTSPVTLMFDWTSDVRDVKRVEERKEKRLVGKFI
jgi:hypothetical protein